MVEKIMMIVSLCVIASVMCRLIGNYNKEQSVMLAVVVCTMIMGFVVINISPVLDFIDEMYLLCGLDERYSVVIFKSIGICYVTRFACDICKDCGENAISTVVEIAGKSALMILSLPLLEELAGFLKTISA